MTKGVLITGDVIHDRFMYQGSGRRDTSLLSEGTHYQKSGGGALLLYRLVKQFQSLPDLQDDTQSFEPHLGVEAAAAFRHGCGIFGVYPGSDEARMRGVTSKNVWRLRESLGYGNRDPGSQASSTKSETLAGNHNVWLLDDGGLDFRQRRMSDATKGDTLANPAWPATLNGESHHLPEWIILKTAAPLGSGDLWHKLSPTTSDDCGNSPFADRLVVVVSAADLRCESASISEGVSWERTAIDVASAIHDNPALIRATQCRYLVVMFGVEGAMIVDSRDAKANRCHLVFDPVHCEGDWTSQIDGGTFGRLSCFVLGILSRLPMQRSDDRSTRGEAEAMIQGAKAGLSAARSLLVHGHGSADDAAATPEFPLEQIARAAATPPACDQFENVVVPCDLTTSRNWRILEGPPDRKMSRKALTLGQARLVAQFGIEKLSGVPRFEMNALKTVDRHEIESLRNIKSLIEHYARSRQSKPLSIGVFGQPGSGKSFGVKQIAKAILGKDVPILEFNLSQLSINEESVLIGAFHQIRDKVLEGHVPVVFWDEFDSANLQWLSKLLAPMQDGAFLEDQSVRPIGKCIFIFAGGTSYDFASFGPPTYSTDELKKLCTDHGFTCEAVRRRYDAEHQHFKKQKGPDFKGRLTTYLNVAGPNPGKDYNWLRDEHDVVETDTGYPLRRAVMLRGQAGLRGSTPFNIDSALLTALLEVDFYRHGARSMEKILEQIRTQARGGRMRLSHLPPDDILNLHVDADAFRRLLDRDLEFQRQSELIAPHIHNSYLEKAATVADEIQREFDKLDSEMRDENIAAARRMPTVLAAAGLVLRPAKGEPNITQELIDHIAAHIDVLAEAEHLGWMENRLRNGWTFNPECTKASGLRPKLRQHDCLVPFSQLYEEDKQLDGDQVRMYPTFAKAARFEIGFAETK